MLRSIGEQAALAVRNAQTARRAAKLCSESGRHGRSPDAGIARGPGPTDSVRRSSPPLGRLSAGIAHEVNNPLQPILNCLEVAIEDIENNQQLDPEGLRIAEREVQAHQADSCPGC